MPSATTKNNSCSTFSLAIFPAKRTSRKSSTADVWTTVVKYYLTMVRKFSPPTTTDFATVSTLVVVMVAVVVVSIRTVRISVETIRMVNPIGTETISLLKMADP